MTDGPHITATSTKVRELEQSLAHLISHPPVVVQKDGTLKTMEQPLVKAQYRILSSARREMERVAEEVGNREEDWVQRLLVADSSRPVPHPQSQDVIKDKWDKRFIALAQHVSTWSKDPSTQVGAVIAKDKTEIAMGYNGFPSSIKDTPDRLQHRLTKYKYTIHAEMNAILKAGKEGRSVLDSTLYLYPLPPCAECAKHVVAAGITRVVALIKKPATGSKYQSFDDTENILWAAGVKYEWHYV